ncbi:MAG: glycosyltransferase family 2 protein [Gammaproteobacteria bacterium]
MELTILMPCLNEAETLASCIQKAKAFLKRENITGEVLIADNGSHDGSQLIAEQEGARLIHVPLRGYGAALQHGIQHAKGRYIIMGDADDSYDFANLSLFVKKLREGYELVMGNRFKGKIEPGAMPFLNKYLGNPVLSFLGRFFFKSQIGDFHCGLRGFKRDTIMQLELQAHGMEFASEMVVKATLNKLKITEVPTTLSPDGRSRRPHLRPWRDGWRHLRLLLLFSPLWLFLYPGFALLCSGAVLMSVLVNGPLNINGAMLDIHTMLFASLFIIVGLQAIFFFIFTHVFLLQDHHLWFVKALTLEKGLILGGALVVLGGGGSIYSFLLWMQSAFGSLVPSQMMRILIPAFTCVIAGVQIIFSSFFISILRLHYKANANGY